MINKYIVVNARIGPEREPYVHDSLRGAQKEAARIAQQDKPAKVYVLQIVGCMKVATTQWEGQGPDLVDAETYDALKRKGSSIGYSNCDDSDEIPF